MGVGDLIDGKKMRGWKGRAGEGRGVGWDVGKGRVGRVDGCGDWERGGGMEQGWGMEGY